MVDQPSGTITLVFTDIVGSTRLLQELGRESYLAALTEHRRIVREACARHSGYEVDYEGDSFFYAFGSAAAAVSAVSEVMRGLPSTPIRVRVGIHTGEPGLDPPKYVGLDVHKAARVMAAGHGGQVLVSETTRDLLDERFRVRDLGEHRLRDLSGPQRLYQLLIEELPDRFPPLRTLEGRRTNLPVQPTSLVGREREIEEVVRLLRREDVSVVTLTGAGGSGKSRLAVQVGAELLDDYPDGVWFVPLAALADPSLVLATIAQTLGLQEGGRTYREVLSEYLRERRLLLVLDNLEQLLPAAAAPLAELAAAAPGLDLLSSSREPLRIAAEHEYPVPPLLPAEAATLFAERAKAVLPRFELDGDRALIETICERLDRLPLAIELAAARVKVLAPAKLLERLEQRLALLTGGARDVPQRQRTLRATIAWSHDLLSADERRLFARLAVFAGGCTLEAAEAACDAGLDTVGSLIDKNLLRREEGPDAELRYAMLETIREFALERLEDSPECEQIRRRHAEHFFAFALAAEPELARREQRRWLDRVQAEHENFRAALGWLLDRGDPELALRLALALLLFWYTRGHIREGRDWLLRSLERATPTPSDTRARALDWTGFFCGQLGEEGRALIEEAVACAREAEAPAALALALCHLASLSAGHCPPGEAVPRLEEARAIAATAGDPFILGITLNNLGVVRSVIRGEAESAYALFEESYRVRAGMGDLARMALSLATLSETAMELEDRARAREFATEALELAREVGDRREAGAALLMLAWVALYEGQVDAARELFTDALALAREISHPTSARIALRGLAAVAAATRAGPLTARLAAATEHDLRESFLAPSLRALVERHLAEAQAETDPVEWEEAWQQGAALSIDQATAEILQATAAN